FRGKHPGQKQQIARLHRFHVSAERLWRRRELDAKFFQPLLGAGGPRAFVSYHLPTCAPPSTCSRRSRRKGRLQAAAGHAAAARNGLPSPVQASLFRHPTQPSGPAGLQGPCTRIAYGEPGEETNSCPSFCLWFIDGERSRYVSLGTFEGFIPRSD